MSSEYLLAAFSDHLAYQVKILLKDNLERMTSPHSRPFFKIKHKVVEDPIFKETIKEAILHWTLLRNKYQNNIVDWWERLGKPGIQRIAIDRSKEINKSKRGNLNIFFVAFTEGTRYGDT